jgi:hypothetical protein
MTDQIAILKVTARGKIAVFSTGWDKNVLTNNLWRRFACPFIFCGLPCGVICSIRINNYTAGVDSLRGNGPRGPGKSVLT